jgi:hypothetical protein
MIVTIVTLLDRAAVTALEEYNPSYVVEACNALQRLGKEKALEQISSYLESSDKEKSNYGLFWVLRVLFDVPAVERFPPVLLGAPNIPPPAEPRRLPRFPIILIRDIPFLVVTKYVLGGLPEQVESHVAYFGVHGILRERPLAPPPSLDSVEDDFLQLWKEAYGEAYLAEAVETIKRQIGRFGS